MTRFDSIEELEKAKANNPDLAAANKRANGIYPLPQSKPLGINSSKPQHIPKTKLVISEADFQTTVIEAAHTLGWRIAHFRPGMTSRTYINHQGKTKNIWVTPVQGDGAGFPDNVLVRDRIIWVELKSEKGNLTAEEYFWGLALLEVGQDYRLWKPSDWEDIVKLLTTSVPANDQHRGLNYTYGEPIEG